MELQNKNGNEIVSAEARKKVLALRVGVGVAAAGGLALLTPMILTAAVGGAGLLALGVLGVVGVGMFQTLPLLGQKFENRLLAARKAEARANPIEQLQHFFISKRERVNAFKQAVISIGTQIKNMRDMLAERKREKPNYDASSKEKALQAMESAHSALKLKYENAEEALEKLEEIIEDKKFDWKFGQAGQEALQNMNATSGQDVLDQMLADEAFDSVRDNFNKVFSELEMEASKLTTKKELSFDDGMTIDLSSIQLGITEKVRN